MLPVRISPQFSKLIRVPKQDGASLPRTHHGMGDERSPVRGKEWRSWRRHDLKRLSVRMWAKGKKEEVKPHRFLEWVWWGCELSLQI